jgi:hypothetical protein
VGIYPEDDIAYYQTESGRMHDEESGDDVMTDYSMDEYDEYGYYYLGQYDEFPFPFYYYS